MGRAMMVAAMVIFATAGWAQAAQHAEARRARFQQHCLPNPSYRGTEDAVLIEGSVGGEPAGEGNFGLNSGIQIGDKGTPIGRMRSLLRFRIEGTAKVERVLAARLKLTIRTVDLKPADGTLQILSVFDANRDWKAGQNNGQAEAGAACWKAKALGAADWAGGPDGIGDLSRPVATIPISAKMADGDVVTVEFPDWMLPVVRGWFESREQNAGLWFRFTDDQGAVLFNSAESVSPGEVPVTARPLLEVEYLGTPVSVVAPPPSWAGALPRPHEGPCYVGDEKQLFIDHRFIE